jgi:MFS superfamily sulfate permease-like transporter
VHVGWALIVAIAVITVSRSRWRWLAAAYPVITLLVVVVTANHFWLDGVAAGLLVALILAGQRKARGIRSGKSSEGPQVKPVRGEMSMRS